MINSVSNSKDSLYALLSTTGKVNKADDSNNTILTATATTATNATPSVTSVSASDSSNSTNNGSDNSSSDSSSDDQKTTSSTRTLPDGTRMLVIMKGTTVIAQIKIGTSAETEDSTFNQTKMNQYLSDGDLPAGSLFNSAG